MENKETTTWQENAALDRYQLIAPLLDPTLDRDKKIALRKSIAEGNGLSEKTLRRYEAYYAEDGFNGLKPQDRTRHRSQQLPDNFDELLSEAIQLKKEVPTRSVRQITFILENEGLAPPGALKRSTLQRYLYNAGFGVKQMRKYTEGRKSSTKRFCKPHRMMLLQADIKYGPVFKDKHGHKVSTYLTSIIDDHSRFILESTFYDNQEAPIVEETIRKAILKYGRFDAVYCDNGKQYVSTQLTKSLSRLGIRILHARPYSGQSKGKVEKFHQVVDDYLAEAKAKKINTVEELNRYWTFYFEEYYQRSPHDGIREYYEGHGITIPDRGISPEEEWNRDTRALVFLDTSVVGEAFLHHETRVVDKGGCLSFKGKRYEVSAALIGATVEIAYDPLSPETITVYYEGMPPMQAKPLMIGSFCDKTPETPIAMTTEPTTSRMLDVLEAMHRKSSERRADAISYGTYRKGGE